MIIFDIECSNGHVFEGWFDSLEEFERQKEKGLISCPYCNNKNVKKILSPVAIKHSNKEDPYPNKEEDKSIDYAQIYNEFVEYIKNNSEDVGSDFAKEALKIHYGITKKRSIRGSATAEEEKILKDEGIEFLKIPMPPDNKKNKH